MLVNCGFAVKTKDLTVDYRDAMKIMRSENIEEYSSVDSVGDKFVFRTEQVECPICHAVFDAREIMASEPIVHTPCEIERFFNAQVDFTSYSNNHTMQLNKAVFKDNPEITCPFCLNKIYRNRAKRKIIMNTSDKSVCIKVEVKSVKELVSSLFEVSDNLTVEIGNSIIHSSWEVLSLEEDGSTYVSFEDKNNNETYRRDITEGFGEDDFDTVLTLISLNKKVKQFLVNYLKHFWRTEFPFNAESLKLEDIITLNRFRGFNKDFYAALPYALGTMKIEKSFHVFKNSDEALCALNDSNIFKAKSIKKHLFEHQGLLIYLPELEVLYKCLNNVDIFFKTICLPDIYILLYYLHKYPCTSQFFRDFCSRKDRTIKLVKLFIFSLVTTCECAKDYGVLSDFYKKEKADENFNEYIKRIEFSEFDLDGLSRCCNDSYSMPMRIIKPSLEDRVSGCDFVYLKSTNETRKTGRELNNCLVRWTCTDSNVIAVKRGVKTVAAIQISYSGRRIVQAKLSDNRNIDEDKKVFAAINAWVAKHNLFYNINDGYYFENDDYYINEEGIA